MQDTSFAIHPGTKKRLIGEEYQDIGNFISYKIKNGIVFLKAENSFVAILFYGDNTARIVMNQNEEPSLKTSFAVIKERELVIPKVNEENETIEIKNGDIIVKITKTPFRVSILNSFGKLLLAEENKGFGFNEKGEVICFKKMEKNDHFYGFGEKTNYLEKRGEKMEMWNTDVYAPHNPETNSLYQSIPFFITLRKGKAHGVFFDNTFKTEFDLKSEEDTYSFKADGGQLDYYVFSGPTIKDVLKEYTTLTGTMPIPPKWALGYHQSRYSYETEAEVRELANNFVNKKIPVDAIYLDIHYMDGYRVFSFDHERFPKVKTLINDLKKAGIKIVPIVDPGVKEDPEYQIYQEGVLKNHFCKYLEGNIYFGDVWPGNSAFPDFTSTKTRKWWGEKHKFYADLGIEGIWNDMNEPAIFNETKTMDVKVMHDNDGQPKTHRELHNVYGFLMGEATYEGMKRQLNGKRTFLLTRAGYAGVQRYASVWTGDNRSFWEHLQLAIPMCMNLGMSGVAFCGPDVGGFDHDATGELLVRWTQFGTFTPYFRNHSAINTVRQEPWAFGENVELLTKKYIEQRYVWLPHLYTLFREANQAGIPVMRPLVLEHPTDENTFNLSDQFMIGNNVIVAPILTPTTKHRVVYLPEGTWVNYWTDELLEGSKHHLVEAPIDILPIFILQGTIVPHGTVKQSTQTPEEELTYHVYVGDEGIATYRLYEDDGATYDYENGKTFEQEVICNYEKNSIAISVIESKSSYTPTWKKETFIIHNLNLDVEVSINGEVKANKFYDHSKKTLKITIQR
ncbi:glycoside hydrolase family 31 protein [Bacillaceae bacterium IKA-2]|nr:glycoside hydrolase family 31 protein [Bacillaceae bacterium IKA-2]